MVIPQVSSYVIIVVGSLLVSCKMLVHSTKGAEAKVSPSVTCLKNYKYLNPESLTVSKTVRD